MANPHCKCNPTSYPFSCPRHCKIKTRRLHELCNLEADTKDRGLKYWNAWEQQLGAGQGCGPDEPVLDMTTQPGISKPKKKEYGPGTELLAIYKTAGMPTCLACLTLAQKMNAWGIEGCRSRITEIVADILPRAKHWIAENKPWINKLIPNAISDAGIKLKIKQDVVKAIGLAQVANEKRKKTRLEFVEKNASVSSSCGGCGKTKKPPLPEMIREEITSISPRPFTKTPKKNLILHCWPNKELWKYHVDKLKLIDGEFERKIVSVATDQNTASIEEVRDSLGASWEYIEVQNDRHLREVVSYRELLKQVESTDKNEVTFCTHTKGTQERTGDSPQVKWWVDAMYDTVIYNWRNVLKEMEKGHSIVGSFRRKGAHFRTRHHWHYSGTFYAFRHDTTFSGGIPEFENRWWGTESWPGIHFSQEEAACIFADDCGDLYHENKELEQELIDWKKTNGVLCT